VTIKENLAAIILWPHGKVNPTGGAALFQNEFIIIPFRTSRNIQQNPRHADHLLGPITMDIHSAASQVIASLCATAEPIHLLTPIPAINDDWNILTLIAI
jgi:hypothetical protein